MASPILMPLDLEEAMALECCTEPVRSRDRILQLSAESRIDVREEGVGGEDSGLWTVLLTVADRHGLSALNCRIRSLLADSSSEISTRFLEMSGIRGAKHRDSVVVLGTGPAASHVPAARSSLGGVNRRP